MVDLDLTLLTLSDRTDDILEYLDLHGIPIRPALTLLDTAEEFIKDMYENQGRSE